MLAKQSYEVREVVANYYYELRVKVNLYIYTLIICIGNCKELSYAFSLHIGLLILSVASDSISCTFS